MTAVYAFSHFAVDLGCAFAVFSANHRSAFGFLLYNFFAFAMQMPLGLLADVLRKNKFFAVSGALLVAVCCLLPQPGLWSICLLGLGNGLFHIGGGLEVMHAAEDRAAPLGIFVSPGAWGIWLGTMLGKAASSPLPVVLLLLLSCAAMVLRKCRRQLALPSAQLPDKTALFPGVLLFFVVILRSFGGMAVSLPWKTGFLSFAAVSCVVLGKALGGILADRFGLKAVGLGSLLLSALLFLFSSSAPLGLMALLLFNMTMPITLHLLADRMPGVKGFSFGLLTFALFLGFLPGYFGASSISGAAMAAGSALSAALLLPCLKEGDAP